MRAEELRIGNWVYIPTNNDKYLQIEQDDFSSNNISDYSLVEFAKPIPLTEEWLLKFGFKKENNFTWGNLKMELKQKEDGFSIWLGADLYLEHVHQLQNLYHILMGEGLKQYYI